MPNSNAAAKPVLDPGRERNYFNQIRFSVEALTRALQANDLAGAQIAFAPLSFLTHIAANDAGPAQQNSFCVGLATIGSALNAGDILAAQGACRNLQLTIRPSGRVPERERSFGF